VGSLDLPDQPDEPGRAIQADAGGADRNAHTSRELPDPDERGRAYEAALEHVSAETPAEASPGERPDAGDERSHRDEVPRFNGVQADRERRRPETPHAAADRPSDRPEQPAATAATVDPTHEGQRTLSPHTQEIEQDNKQGGRLDGSERQLKGEDRLEENVSAETPDEASRGQPPDTADHRSYWDEVPRFRDLWANHEKDWPKRQSATKPDHSSDPPGTYRSEGGLKLKPEQHVETIAAIGRMRETESAISADVRSTEQDNKYGGWLEGFDHRLKGDDRLKEKVAEKVRFQADREAAAIIREIPDAIRYTFCLRSDTYTKGYFDIKERLESCGYSMYESRNTWDGAEYKGINTRWITPAGQRFEVQFHTPESFHAKQHVTHLAYERIRNRLTSDAEREKLKDFQQEVCSWIKAPDGAQEIPDFKKEGF
jgi:hypothetical protein